MPRPKVCCSPGVGARRMRRWLVAADGFAGRRRRRAPSRAAGAGTRPTVTSTKSQRSAVHSSPRWRAVGAKRFRKIASADIPRARSLADHIGRVACMRRSARDAVNASGPDRRAVGLRPRPARGIGHWMVRQRQPGNDLGLDHAWLRAAARSPAARTARELSIESEPAGSELATACQQGRPRPL